MNICLHVYAITRTVRSTTHWLDHGSTTMLLQKAHDDMKQALISKGLRQVNDSQSGPKSWLSLVAAPLIEVNITSLPMLPPMITRPR